jgi:ssRNA-specific RNase YbeY (16S rRNA maturation enzyme)
MLEVEFSNRSGLEVEEEGAAALARRVLAAEGIVDGELGITFVDPEESQRLKREHLGIDEPTDVL